MRSMVLEFENDKTCAFLDRQYMLGGKLLVAPIFREDGIAEYYLPEGTWTNYLTGETRTGGVWVSEHHDYLSIPLWVKENSIIPICREMERNDDSYKDQLELKVYELKDQATTVVYEDQKQVLGINLVKENGTVTCNADPEKSYKIRFVNQKFSNVENAEFAIDGNDTVVTVTDPKASIICK